MCRTGGKFRRKALGLGRVSTYADLGLVDRSCCKPRNRAAADAVAFCQRARRLAFGEPLPRLLDLVRGEFRLTPHPDALGAGNLSAFVGALDDPQPFVLGHGG